MINFSLPIIPYLFFLLSGPLFNNPKDFTNDLQPYSVFPLNDFSLFFEMIRRIFLKKDCKKKVKNIVH